MSKNCQKIVKNSQKRSIILYIKWILNIKTNEHKHDRWFSKRFWSFQVNWFFTLLFLDIAQYVLFIWFILVFLVLFCASGYLTLQAYFAFNEELKKIGNRKYQLKLKRITKTNHLSEETVNDSPYGGVIEFWQKS